MSPSLHVESLLDDGQKLIAVLTEEGFPVIAAVWLKEEEIRRWHLYLASARVDRPGPTRCYALVNRLIRRMPQPFWIDLLDVRLIGSKSPIVQAVAEVHQRYPGGRLARFGEGRFG